MSMRWERGNSSQEGIAVEVANARESLKNNLSLLLQQRGVFLADVLKRGGHVAARLLYDDMERRELPAVLNDFIDNSFDHRSVGVTQIDVDFQRLQSSREEAGGITIHVAKMYPRKDKAPFETRQIATSQDSITGLPVIEKIADLEHQEDNKYLILPDSKRVVYPKIRLMPFESPLESVLSGFSLDVWLSDLREQRGALSAYEKIKNKIKPENRMVDPYGILGLDRPQRPFRIAENYSSEVSGEIILAIARLLPDLQKTTRKVPTAFGIMEEDIPEPVKEIIIR